MKFVPAIDENGEFVEARLRTGVTVRVYSTIYRADVSEDFAVVDDGRIIITVPSRAFDDWPAVRERVEWARAEREGVAREDAKRLEAFGAEDRTASGVKINYSRNGAASVDAKELFEKVVKPQLDAEAQRNQRAGLYDDPPAKRPSFAEALLDAAKLERRETNNTMIVAVMDSLIDVIQRARAASGE